MYVNRSRRGKMEKFVLIRDLFVIRFFFKSNSFRVEACGYTDLSNYHSMIAEMELKSGSFKVSQLSLNSNIFMNS